MQKYEYATKRGYVGRRRLTTSRGIQRMLDKGWEIHHSEPIQVKGNTLRQRRVTLRRRLQDERSAPVQ